eukprot:2661983-Pyramimonas_sp.AAC.1
MSLPSAHSGPGCSQQSSVPHSKGARLRLPSLTPAAPSDLNSLPPHEKSLAHHISLPPKSTIRLAKHWSVRVVAFVSAYVLELSERLDRPCCTCEPYLEGAYKKHNNNYGSVATLRDTPQSLSSLDSSLHCGFDPDPRSAESAEGSRASAAPAESSHRTLVPPPQAFSHFSYEHSQRKLLVCDIQGVADFYTDPQ